MGSKYLGRERCRRRAVASAKVLWWGQVTDADMLKGPEGRVVWWRE